MKARPRINSAKEALICADQLRDRFMLAAIGVRQALKYADTDLMELLSWVRRAGAYKLRVTEAMLERSRKGGRVTAERHPDHARVAGSRGGRAAARKRAEKRA